MDTKGKGYGNYLKFFAMIGTSMVAMFFLMYLNSHQIIKHFWFSETRLFMTLIMGGAMIMIDLFCGRCKKSLRLKYKVVADNNTLVLQNTIICNSFIVTECN